MSDLSRTEGCNLSVDRHTQAISFCILQNTKIWPALNFQITLWLTNSHAPSIDDRLHNLASAKSPFPKATRKRAKLQPSPSFGTQIMTFPSAKPTEPTEPTPPISQLQPFRPIRSCRVVSLYRRRFLPTYCYARFSKGSPTECVNEGERCSYDCDEETTLEILFSFSLREITFYLALHLIQNLNRNLGPHWHILQYPTMKWTT